MINGKWLMVNGQWLMVNHQLLNAPLLRLAKRPFIAVIVGTRTAGSRTASASGVCGTVLGCSQVHGSFPGFLRFQRGHLCGTTGHGVELGAVYQVLEVHARSEQDVHRFDVLGRELFDAFRPLAADGNAEGSQFAQLDFVAVEQLLDQALTHVGDDSLDRASRIHAIVVGDVLGKLFQRPDLGHLVLGIRLGRLVLTEGWNHHVN